MKPASSPMKAIRAKCLDCSCDNAQEVRLCVVPNCPLYPFRMGKNPCISEKRREAGRKAAARMHEKVKKRQSEQGNSPEEG